MHKLITILAAVLMTVCAVAAPKHYELKSPDGKLTVKVDAKYGLGYTLTHGDDLLLNKSFIAMYMMDDTTFGKEEKLAKVSYRSVDQTIDAIAYKKSKVSDKFNEMTLSYKEFSVIFRAYDDGMAYRFVSHLKKPADLQHELVYFNFAQDWNMWAAYVSQHTETLDSQFYNSFENHYSYAPISEWNTERLAFLPLMVDGPNGKKIVITESDLDNYPGMYLYKYPFDEASALTAKFAPCPKEVKQGGHNNLQMEVQKREPYIAECDGPREFPWRIVAVSENDVQMADNDMVYRLAKPADPTKDWSWVKPGKVAWDWWNDWNIDGVDFKSGINNDTYKYYIDFASKNGIEYVILDEGWSVNGAADLFQVVPEIDLEMLARYASERNVGLILWAGYWAFDRDMEKVCEHYSKMGIKGFKIDFMDRDDQYMVEFHRRAAETAAKYHMLADFHGSYKPTGLHRTYPNVINYEGVHGLETMKWSDASVDQVTYDVTVPYIRMMAGPMDYTQGAMRNATRGNYHPVYNEPMSQGTRCRQLSQYVIFDSPLNMLCDSPSNYMREQECLEFIAEIPTVWDETKGLCGEVGKYIAMARRSGDEWYVGAMTDWSSRELVLDLSFLPEGSYQIEIYRDGANAYRIARDYKKEIIDLPSDRKLTVNMAPGGGFAAKIVKK
jgi:alpha-glucosidase